MINWILGVCVGFVICGFSQSIFAQDEEFQMDDVPAPMEPTESQEMDAVSPNDELPPEPSGDPEIGEAVPPPPGATKPEKEQEFITAAPDEKNGSEENNLFEPIQLGPTLSVGFPHPINFGLNVFWDRKFGGEISFGSVTTPEIGGVAVSISNLDVRGRWHPITDNSFFVGAAFGNQTISAETKKEISVNSNDINTKLKLKVDTTYLTPHVGWFSVWENGLTMGFEIGYQIAMNSKAKDVDISAGSKDKADAVKSTDEYKDLEKTVKDSAERFGKQSVPYLNLLRIGWMF